MLQYEESQELLGELAEANLHIDSAGHSISDGDIIAAGEKLLAAKKTIGNCCIQLGITQDSES